MIVRTSGKPKAARIQKGGRKEKGRWRSIRQVADREGGRGDEGNEEKEGGKHKMEQFT